MKEFLTEDEVDKILSGDKRAVKVYSIWDFKKDYNGSIALINRSGGTRIAMPHLDPSEGEPEEFKCALNMIKQVQEAIDAHTPTK